MNVLITGGAGYIGSVLAGHLLGRGHHVRVLDCLLHGGKSLLGMYPRDGFEFFHADLRNREAVELACKGMDAAVHLAAIVGDPACARQKDLARQVNLDASLALAACAENAGIQRFIFASTCSNYGKMIDPSSHVDETSELKPVSLYAETKVAVEQSLLGKNASSVCNVILRFATVHGISPRMRFDLTVNEFAMEMLINGKIQVYGPQFWRPYIHVCDIARAVEMVLLAPNEQVKNEIFNVGDSCENYQKRSIAEMILKRLPAAKVEYVEKGEDPRDYRVSFEKIKKILGFRISRTLQDGIDEILEGCRMGIFGGFNDPGYRN